MINKDTKSALRDHLFSFITENKRNRIPEVLSTRTRYMTVVLEDIFKSFNASAVLRSADCFGVQDVHIIENKNSWELNKHVVKGATKWLTLHRYNENEQNTLDCIQHLKKEGYRIVATTPHTNDVELPDFDIEKGKFALVFGTEQFGISDIVKENADEFLRIPIYGFTESYNVSVSAALSLYELSRKLHQSDLAWRLTECEIQEIELEWIKRIVTRSEIYEREFLKKYN